LVIPNGKILRKSSRKLKKPAEIQEDGDSKKEEIAFAQTYFAIQTRNSELIQKRLSDTERVSARDKLVESENKLSGIIYERGVDSQGFARIRSKGDAKLFGGFTTKEMKRKYNVPENRPLADFLPTVTIKAKDFANEITTHNIITHDLQGEDSITSEHEKSNTSVREALTKSGIKPENLPPVSDVKKVKRNLDSEGKKLLSPPKNSKNKSEEESKG
jgi:DNA-damage-inducible protein D